ncbi:MAG: RluA family pseudouridine synthase [Eubacteriales bacterium]|nr:RluA family pseudouridine synthase [Eubacteriales bacterium]MDD3200182.1 RluA family pseudouridine synthase [Eubacteriales bacterium]MDD4121649.1 RluA family pseudouridine synthase [Eubacteriales bacterium]MDD4630295.1 RluA family pseudouridine synthase [Eubacteriales bacterium]
MMYNRLNIPDGVEADKNIYYRWWQMINITITENEENQRLDRFLKKYFKNAPLSYIYKLIRKDVKVNGKRAAIETLLAVGDELIIYIAEDEAKSFQEKKSSIHAKKQFRIAYEDENVIIVEKPFGLLVHGDKTEKKNTLANQVIGYLIEKGDYSPGNEKTFVPSPVNRLDRNTTGLVIFGKNNKALQSLNQMIRERGYIRKYYLTIVHGELRKSLQLKDRMEKDERANKTLVTSLESDEGKIMETLAKPLKAERGYTLIEVELITGRTHQIRAHLAKAGYPVIGDVKYGVKGKNKKIEKEFHLTTQLLHAYKLCFDGGVKPLNYMKGMEVKADLPANFEAIANNLFGRLNDK